MLIWFVVLYLLVSIGIGLYAATRSRTLPITWSPAGICRCPFIIATVFRDLVSAQKRSWASRRNS